MRENLRYLALFSCIALVVATGIVSAQEPGKDVTPPAPTPEPSPEAAEPEEGAASVYHGDRVGVGNPVRVAPDEIVSGDVVAIGTRVEVEGVVRGDVVGVGSRVEIRGEVRGDVVGVGSSLRLAPGARVRGEIVNVMGSMDDQGAKVGHVVDISPGANLPALGHVPLGIFGFFSLWWKLLGITLVFVVLLLHSAVVPDRVRVISDETPVRPVVAFLVGLLGYASLFVVSVFLAVTLVGIPLVILLYFVFKILQWLGLAGIFHYVGRRIGAAFGKDLSLLGAVLIGFLPFALLRFLPFCTGWFLWFILEIVAVGFVVLTRAGTRGTAVPGPASAPPAEGEPAPAAG